MYITEFENEKKINDWTIKTDFNYYCASYVSASNGKVEIDAVFYDAVLVVAQLDNEGFPTNDVTYHSISMKDSQMNIEELKEQLNKLDYDLPKDVFIKQVEELNKCISENYNEYWKENSVK